MLLGRLREPSLVQNGVMPWAAPVPVFGDISGAKLATVAINPSGREFVAKDGSELTGRARRFHTLSSLQLSDWSEANAGHITQMLDSYAFYFRRNPYDIWFKPLEKIMSGTPFSLYGSGACHLDLIPYATCPTWTDLSTQQRFRLLAATADILPLLLNESAIRVLILNGKRVVQSFEEMSGTTLRAAEVPGWSLPTGKRAPGFSFRGEIERLAGVSFKNPILVLGYNHNLQSSFGVTTDAKERIGSWIADEARKYLHA